MKKIIMLLSLLSCSIYEDFAQNKVSDFYERTYPPILESCTASPVMARLFSYDEFSFRHSTGQVDIQIPIHELTMNYLSIPIGISYNSSGVRIQDNPGIIGYGWSLNCGFKISRSIRGKDDLEYPVIQDKVIDFCNSTALDGDYIRQLTRIAPEDSYNAPNAWEDNKMDGQYDIFNIELPNLSVSFILEYNNGIYSARPINPTPLSIKLLTRQKEETRKIDATKTLTRRYTVLYGIEVTDDNGICYKFGETEQRDSRDQNKYTEYNKPSTRAGLLKTAWMLREVVIGTNNIVRFSYKDAVDYFDFQPTIITTVMHQNFLIQDPNAGSQNDLWILTGNPNAAIHDENHIEYNMNLAWIRYKNNGYEDVQGTLEPNYFKLIKSISNSGIEIEFNYDSIQKIGNPELPSISSYYRQTLSSLNVFSKINNIKNGKIKEVIFYNHEGFLDSLSISGNGKYKFSYDRRDKNFSIDQFQKAIDWWGYCNGKNNISSLPRDASGNNESRRAPDSLFTKVRALERIVYPTGGNVKINYGTHIFQDGSYGGGLRVESLETFDPSSGKMISKRFKYENPRYSGIPVGVTECSSRYRTHLYAGKDITLVFSVGNGPSYHAFAYEVDIDVWSTFTFPVVYTPYTSFNAWYERVTEENEEGKIEYKFEYLPTALDPEFLDGTIDYTMSHREPSLTSQRIFKKNETGGFELVRSVENTYTRDFVPFYEVNVVNSYREMSTYEGINRRGSYEDLSELNFSLYPSRVMRTLAIGQVSLKKVQETSYFQNDSTSIITNYLYDRERPYNLVFKTVLPKDRDLITQKYYYNNNQLPENKGINASDHGLGNCTTHKTTVIQQETRRNNKLVSSSLTYFKGVINSALKVPKEKYYAGPDGVMEKREEYPRYDEYGNPVEIVKDKHSTMVRLWSYQGMYPVAEIRNATYQQVENALGTLAETLPGGWLSDQVWVTLNSNLRSSVYLKNALVTTYKYKPLVGIIEMIDPRGKSTYYDYDVHGRLKEIYIIEGGIKKLLQENEYKYYNEK